MDDYTRKKGSQGATGMIISRKYISPYLTPRIIERHIYKIITI